MGRLDDDPAVAAHEPELELVPPEPAAELDAVALLAVAAWWAAMPPPRPRKTAALRTPATTRDRAAAWRRRRGGRLLPAVCMLCLHHADVRRVVDRLQGRAVGGLCARHAVPMKAVGRARDSEGRGSAVAMGIARVVGTAGRDRGLTAGAQPGHGMGTATGTKVGPCSP
jgi:hypothetical protein